MMYLITKCNQKNARRHIVTKSNDIEYLRRLSENLNIRYHVEIYDGRWNLIETIR